VSLVNDPFTTTVDLARALRQREVSAAEVMEAHLERIRRVNPAVNAIVTLDAARALERAHAADVALAAGECWGPLHGVPFTLKDAHATEGVLTTVGAPEFANHVPSYDGTVAARLKAAGAILLGKTNVPPMLMSAQTDNPLFGRTNNPWNLGRTAGGSSGGAGAAVAAGLTPFDVGSDLSGSIRMPAHFNGIFGLKPTANRIPRTGHLPPPPGILPPDRILGAAGPMARSVPDLELIAGLLAGSDGVDTDVPPVPWRTVERFDLKKLRIAFRTSFDGVPTSRAARAAVERVVAKLASAGAQVEERDPGFGVAALNDVWQAHLRILGAVLRDFMGGALPVSPGEGPEPTASDVLRVLGHRDALIGALESLLTRVDAFVSPAGICTAFPHSAPRSPILLDDGALVSSRYVDHYLYPFNFTGSPCVVIPAGLADDGLPVGVQLVGARWKDERLLAIAEAVSREIGGFVAPPELSAVGP
jgi:amidase